MFWINSKFLNPLYIKISTVDKFFDCDKLILDLYLEVAWVEITLQVNKDGDIVKFALNGIRGSTPNTYVFWPYEGGDEAKHLHPYNKGGNSTPHDYQPTPMTQRLISYWPDEKMAFFCKECGLRFVMPTNEKMSEEELREYFFKERNQSLIHEPCLS